MPEQPQLSSSPTSMPSKAFRPRPPYSAGTWRFISPTSWPFAITSAGWRMATSQAAAFGRISLAAKRSEEHTSELQSRQYLVCRPPSTPLFPYTTLFRSDAGTAPVELLADEHAVEGVQTEAAVLRRDVEVHQPDLVALRDHLGRMAHGDVAGRSLRTDLPGREEIGRAHV